MDLAGKRETTMFSLDCVSILQKSFPSISQILSFLLQSCPIHDDICSMIKVLEQISSQVVCQDWCTFGRKWEVSQSLTSFLPYSIMHWPADAKLCVSSTQRVKFLGRKVDLILVGWWRTRPWSNTPITYYFHCKTLKTLLFRETLNKCVMIMT